MNEYYIQGFIDKCAEHNIDPIKLAQWAAPKELHPDNPLGGTVSYPRTQPMSTNTLTSVSKPVIRMPPAGSTNAPPVGIAMSSPAPKQRNVGTPPTAAPVKAMPQPVRQPQPTSVQNPNNQLLASMRIGNKSQLSNAIDAAVTKGDLALAQQLSEAGQSLTSQSNL